MSGLVRKLSHMQKGRFEDFCQRCRRCLDRGIFFFTCLEFSMVETYICHSGDPWNKSNISVSLVCKCCCPADAATALTGPVKESRSANHLQGIPQTNSKQMCEHTYAEIFLRLSYFMYLLSLKAKRKDCAEAGSCSGFMLWIPT